MKNRFQLVIASAAIVLSAIAVQIFMPREMMASSAGDFDLRAIIPDQVGDWKLAPEVKLIEPEDDSLSRKLYSQEVARGYRDSEGHLIMLLVAYGPNQSARLQMHRPEICYTAAGFRVSTISTAKLTHHSGIAPLDVLRLTARREGRTEQITYWMRVGDAVPADVFNKNLVRLRLVLQGKIADGVLIRVSTIGLPADVSYQLQDRFIDDLLSAIQPNNLNFFIGKSL